MTELQTWVLINTFAVLMISLCIFVIVMMAWQARHFSTQLLLMRDGILAEMRGELATVRSELLEEIASIRTDLARIDRDVQTISRRIFGDEKL